MIYQQKIESLAEKFLAGVYIDNDYLKLKLKTEGDTKLGGKIYSFSKLKKDLIKWNK